jgi:phosphopantetheinyl transferase
MCNGGRQDALLRLSMQATLVDLDCPALVNISSDPRLLGSDYDRVSRLLREIDRRRLAASIIARKYILSELMAVLDPMSINLIRDDYGCPAIANGPDAFHFSVSRSERWMVLATDIRRIGVDIEQSANCRHIVRFLHSDWVAKEEAQQFADRWQNTGHRRFLIVWWTAREAYAKLMGTGLRPNSFQIRIDFDTSEAQAIDIHSSTSPILGWWNDTESFHISIASASSGESCAFSHWTIESGLSFPRATISQNGLYDE